ncbi:hypothetical protein AOLI_G00221310 [Acnodon oligacanthus]
MESALEQDREQFGKVVLEFNREPEQELHRTPPQREQQLWKVAPDQHGQPTHKPHRELALQEEKQRVLLPLTPFRVFHCRKLLAEVPD